MNTTVMIAACQRKSCVNVPIVNDAALEIIELFSVSLTRTPGLDSSIELTPVDGRIEIIDNDGV